MTIPTMPSWIRFFFLFLQSDVLRTRVCSLIGSRLASRAVRDHSRRPSSVRREPVERKKKKRANIMDDKNPIANWAVNRRAVNQVLLR